MSTSRSARPAETLRDWVGDNRWKARFIAVEAFLVVGAFVVAAFGGPPSSGVNSEPTLRVISGMMLVYAGVLAIVAVLVSAGYAAVRRLQHDSIAVDRTEPE